MSIYCISVRTGLEEKFKESIELAAEKSLQTVPGIIHLLRKKMKLKNGKEYFEQFFPGYVFLETDETDFTKFRFFRSGKGFLRFLPSDTDIHPLVNNDFEIVRSIINYGSVMGIVSVEFDENDRIVITEGPFKNMSGRVVAVNKRNKRLNISLDFMGGAKIVGLSYEIVKKS